MKQKHLQVFGTVQGVGFRYYTQRLANKYNILGTVQNVDDYVEIYAIGNDDDLEQFINAGLKVHHLLHMLHTMSLKILM